MQNSELIKGLVMTAACVTEKEMQKQYLGEILVPITEKCVSFRNFHCFNNFLSILFCTHFIDLSVLINWNGSKR